MKHVLTMLLLAPLAVLFGAEPPFNNSQETQLKGIFDFSAELPAGWTAKGSAFGKGDAVRFSRQNQSYYAVASAVGGDGQGTFQILENRTLWLLSVLTDQVGEAERILN